MQEIKVGQVYVSKHGVIGKSKRVLLITKQLNKACFEYEEASKVSKGMITKLELTSDYVLQK